MVDSSSRELLQELRRVQSRTQLTPLVAIGGFLLLLTAIGTAKPSFLIAGVAGFLLLVLIIVARHLDVTHGTAILRYELDVDADASFSNLNEGFAQLRSCLSVWHIEATKDSVDRKRNAGASQLVSRQAIRPILSLPPRVECNLRIPALPAGAQTLYFFPDRILVYERSGVGAVAYDDLSVESGQTSFIEAGSVPADAQVLGQTWKYVNKAGGPDRRFSDNRELPIVAYGAFHLTSTSGLNEMFNCSKVTSVAAFTSAIPKRVAPSP